MEFSHKSVLLDETIEGLNIKPDGVYVDGTMGGAGHSSEIVKRLSGDGMLIGIDRDSDALAASRKRLADFKNVRFVHNNFSSILEILEEENIPKIHGALIDLGVSSYQLDCAERGFSYMEDAPLDMRMSKQGLSAYDVINTYDERGISRIQHGIE